MDESYDEEENTIELAIDGVLDLHAFRPGDIGSLIPEYLMECRKKKIFHVRIIHGKGMGNLRRGTHAVLSRSKLVKKYFAADEKSGSWGATLVELHEKELF